MCVAAQNANRNLGCIKRSRLKEVILLIFSALMTPHLSTVFSSGLQRKRDMDLLEQVRRKATKMTRELEHLCYEERLRELGLFSLEKSGLRGDLMGAFQYLKGAAGMLGRDCQGVQ